eukprot:45434-Pleurochrysis_carterae.AAC.1
MLVADIGKKQKTNTAAPPEFCVKQHKNGLSVGAVVKGVRTSFVLAADVSLREGLSGVLGDLAVLFPIR